MGASTYRDYSIKEPTTCPQWKRNECLIACPQNIPWGSATGNTQRWTIPLWGKEHPRQTIPLWAEEQTAIDATARGNDWVGENNNSNWAGTTGKREKPLQICCKPNNKKNKERKERSRLSASGKGQTPRKGRRKFQPTKEDRPNK